MLATSTRDKFGLDDSYRGKVALGITYGYNFQNSKTNRFELLDAIKGIRGMAKQRVSNCMNFITRDGNRSVDVIKSESGVRFEGVTVCDSVWLCPVCNSRVMNQHKHELDLAVRDSDYHTVLMTFTLAHSVNDRLKDLEDLLKSSLNSTFSGRWYEDFQEKYHMVARATTTEHTRSDVNGWHPHIHILAFCKENPNASMMQSELNERFTRFVMKKGGYASIYHAVDVRNTKRDVSGYLSKWNIPTEMTRLQAKSAKGVSLTIWEIAQLAGNGNEKYIRLWNEYVAATYRKKLFTWSRGAKELLGLDDVEKKLEEKLANEEKALIVSLTVSEWNFILNHKLVALVHHLAMNGGAKAINEMMIRIRGIPLENYDVS